MGSDLAGFKRCGKSSGRPLATKIGQLAYWSVVALIFGWAAWLRFRLPLDPIALSNYLLPALRKLIGPEFGQIHLGRTIIYPGFVYLLLRVFGDFRAITITQNLLGLLAGGIFLLTWRRIRGFIPSARLPHPIYHGLGLLAVAIYMFSREPLLFERDIRPEGICGFLISINLYFVIEFTACCFLEGRRTATVIYGIAAVFSSILLASVKPSFWLTAIVLFSRGSANRYGHLWDRGRVQLDFAGLSEAKLLADRDCRASTSRDVFLSAALVLAKDCVCCWGCSECGVAIATGALPHPQ